jgi:hypothetical protein
MTDYGRVTAQQVDLGDLLDACEWNNTINL